MGWITIPSGATNSQRNAILSDCEVITSKQSVTTVLFAKNGALTIRQRETQTITEYRGLSEADAKAMVGVTDNTEPVTYYANIDGDIHTITVQMAKANTDGKVTELSAARSNEARGWMVTKRETEYSLEPGINTTAFTNVWKTSLTNVADANGVVVSVDKSIQACRGYGKGLFTTNTVTVKEFRGLTLAEATAKASNLTYSNAQDTTIQYWSYVGSGVSGATSSGWVPGAWYTVVSGTDSRASVRKDSDGVYTVTQTITEYDWTPKSSANADGWKTSAP